jgi:hypothetical protein
VCVALPKSKSPRRLLCRCFLALASLVWRPPIFAVLLCCCWQFGKRSGGRWKEICCSILYKSYVFSISHTTRTQPRRPPASFSLQVYYTRTLRKLHRSQHQNRGGLSLSLHIHTRVHCAGPSNRIVGAGGSLSLHIHTHTSTLHRSQVTGHSMRIAGARAHGPRSVTGSA